MTEQPKLAKKQQAILQLLYRFRFLNRIQIQTLMGHKDPKTINLWLKDLREKQYVEWIYSTHFAEKTKPAIYYLSLNSVRHLRTLTRTIKDKDNASGVSPAYPPEELRKRYKEPTRTEVFIKRCLLIADCYIALQAKSDDRLHYNCVLLADYADPDSEYYFLNELKPHLFFSKQRGDETTNYLMENFEQTLPRYQLSKRLKDYVDYLTYEWDEDDGPPLIALLVCASVADLIYVKRRVRSLSEDKEDLQIRVTTLGKLKDSGITSMIWEDVF